jgi:hypothetical protein
MKSERPEKICITCKKKKYIVKHLNGDLNAPLCAACNMRLRRGSASCDQTKRLKLAVTIIGIMEQILGLDIASAHEQEIIAMQERLKTLARAWLYDQAEDTKPDPLAPERSADATANPHGPHSSPSWFELSQAERDEKIEAGRRESLEKRRAQRDAKRGPETAP